MTPHDAGPVSRPASVSIADAPARPGPGPARARVLAVLVALGLAFTLAACEPRSSEDDIRARALHPLCRSELLGDADEAALETALFALGRGSGLIAGDTPARAFAARQTRDGYLVRRLTSNLVMSLALLGLGALAAALILTLGQRRPKARWAERLAQSLASEIDSLRRLGQGSDAVSKALVERFGEVLDAAMTRANALLARAMPLAKREGAPTAQAQLESLHEQLASLLALVERAHLKVLVWQERQHEEERKTLEQQLDQVLASLKQALDEVRP